MTDRILIAGVPKAGKTPLAHELVGGSGYRCAPGAWCRHTDDLIRPGAWSEASEEASHWFNAPGPWVIEGVAIPRALRKWLAAHPEGKPCDRLIWMDRPLIELEPGRLTMAKGCRTVWREIAGAVLARGVVVEER